MSGDLTCRVCGATGPHPHHTAREMMFGTRETFDYFKCSDCGCLQITEIPADMSSHYGQGYYSFSMDPALAYRRPLKNLLNRLRDRVMLFAPGGQLALPTLNTPQLRIGFEFLRRVPGLSLDTRIVDVGCGTAILLYRLHNVGFRDLTGADPFLSKGDHQVGPGFRMLRQSAETLDGQYDIVLMNHSFEHVPDAAGTMAAVARRLAPGGTAIIRVPLVDSLAWERFGTDWFQLDAPRHFYLHTQKSLRLLAERAGLKLVRTVHDSNHEQFTYSDRYRQNVPLGRDPSRPDGKPHYDGPEPTQADIARNAALAEQVNAEGRGDQATFYLQHA